LNVSLLDFEGHTLWSQKQEMEIGGLNSKVYLAVPLSTMLEGKDRKKIFVFDELLVGGKRVSSNEYFFEPFKNLGLQPPQISAAAVRTPAGFKITLSSDKLARAVYLSAGNQAGFFSDNYFNLIPGKKVEVEFRTTTATAVRDFRAQLHIRSLTDAF
jgi:beta-mannosidase